MAKSLKELIGTEIEKTCPECGAQFIIRQNKTDNNFFLGCARYPLCTETAPIPEEYLMREAGQASFLDDIK